MPDEKSIIQIIQRMVEENEPEEKIVNTLQTLGVEKTQASRLLLIAQADTFTLLKSEIDKIVQQRIDEKRKLIEQDAQKFIDSELETKKKEVKVDLEKEFLRYKLGLSDSQKAFQESVSESVSKIAKLNEEVYSMAEENKKMIKTVEKDLTETKLKGVKMRRSLMKNTITIAGVASYVGAVILLAGTMQGPFNIDQLTGFVESLCF